MFRQQNSLSQQIEKVLAKQRQITDQPITIRDIKCFSMYQFQSYGETNHYVNFYEGHQSLERLIDHIESLAAITNLFHEEKYCEKINGEVSVKPDCRNHITRLSLSEFLLYTEKPLTESEFNLLIEAIYIIAAKFNDNVHLLLSSFSVAINKGVILNTSLYVQCGATSSVEIIAKLNASSTDVVYPGHHLFHQITNVSDSRRYQGEYIAKKDGRFVVNRCVFPVGTLGGAKYLQAIDICLDHDERVAKQAVERLVGRCVENQTEYLPAQIDHIVTSNSIQLIAESCITDNVVQVDAQYTPKEKRVYQATSINDEQLRACFKNKYSRTRVIEGVNCFYVTSPCFGPTYTLVLCNERPLSTYKVELREQVNQRNAELIEYKKMRS